MKRYPCFLWVEFLVGVLLVVLGIFTFLRPGSALTWLVLFYGLLAVFTGIIDIIFYIRTENYIGFGPTVSLVSGILSVLSGMVLLVYPGVGRWAMAVFFPMWFIAHCVSRLSHLGFVKPLIGRGYYLLMLVMNVAGLICGFAMLFLPAASMTLLNYVVGTWLTLLGIDSILLACSKAGKR